MTTTTVRVGDTVEWTNLEPIGAFGPEPVNAIPPSSVFPMDGDGVPHATISSPTESVNLEVQGRLVTPPLPKARFVLTDTSDETFDFRHRTGGYVTLLFFGCTNCSDECPMHISNLGAALKKLPASVADQVKLVFVTTDPAPDSPVVVRQAESPGNREP